MNEVNLIQASIEQLERVSRSMASIGETEDYTEVAINALDKQIPKKPRKTDSYRGIFRRIYAYVCPACGNACLEKQANERQDTMFCWNCGQKIEFD